MSLSQNIKTKAAALGFSLVGISTPGPLPHRDIFAFWLKAGRQGEMGYLDTERSRECRAHPQRILPECRSVIALAMRYPAPTLETNAAKSLTGKVAAYAWGADYHDIFPERMQRLVRFIKELVGHPVPNRWYTDTGPILERELAQRAGFGWIGKNTCLIHPRLGSYFLLGELLLGIDLEPDQPFTADRCGTCTRCIRACPTGCILPDRTIDARRCISYLTIELKGSIPPELRPLMGNWVFGCDVCQLACPWNRFAAPLAGDTFTPNQVSPPPNLLEELALTTEEFNHKYRHSPLKRARRRGYLRNVTVALGNAHDPAAIPQLSQALGSEPEPLVRGHAAWALGQVGGEIARHAMQQALASEIDPIVRREIQTALENH